MKITVETKLESFQFPGFPEETVLTAGLAAGYSLPYECATGTCGTCHARVMDGPIDAGWTDAPGYAKLNREKGDILMCQARPLGDCSLRVRSNTAQPKELTPAAIKRIGRIENTRRLTGDVIHFEVALPSPMSFDAGQFVTCQVASLAGRRAYSMVNFGKNLERLHFVVKRKPTGKFSDWLFENHVDGAEIEIVGPLGRATFRPGEERDVICIAGGSGIAGMMSILEHASQMHYFHRHRGRVFFGVRTLADAFYLEDFAKHIASANGGLEVTVATSHEQVATPLHPQFSSIGIASGMVHEVAAASMTDQWNNAIGFVAGPQPMVDATLRVLIAEAGLRTDSIRFDKFS
ncbi:2Fe-2S iron-sulfur cluster-binding protein [Methylocella silvestris]|uniref:Oxidoreductase n=1 Tax=Methylocella silvestris TaxID=199596 RepID=A0A2J7TDT5_METSI|nr:2Fe-2S iron-sulfur cluster binding domain-containing protein [Methylocella silvestris]PNG24928.1 oxidoreductase [Methylocella silvestris]